MGAEILLWSPKEVTVTETLRKRAVVRAWAHSEGNTGGLKICCEEERNSKMSKSLSSGNPGLLGL